MISVIMIVVLGVIMIVAGIIALHLKNLLAAIILPVGAATSLIPVTINSLDKIMITIHTGTIPSTVSINNAVITNNLSAKGSINLPNVVPNHIF